MTLARKSFFILSKMNFAKYLYVTGHDPVADFIAYSISYRRQSHVLYSPMLFYHFLIKESN